MSTKTVGIPWYVFVRLLALETLVIRRRLSLVVQNKAGKMTELFA